jgi:hypothetical protein
MASTATKVDTLRNELSAGNANTVANAAQQARLGDILSPLKYTVTAFAGAVAIDITSKAIAALATAGAFTPPLTTPDDINVLPAVLNAGCVAVRVTGGAAAAGPRIVTDAGGTPSATVCTLSDDGKTLTFEAAVTDFVIEYLARSAKDVLTAFAPQTR